MSELLTNERIDEALTNLPGWDRADSALVRTVELSSFPQAIQVVTRVAEIAEDNNHHPDIDIRWRTLTFRCGTHSAGGITDADVTLATVINATLDDLA